MYNLTEEQIKDKYYLIDKHPSPSINMITVYERKTETDSEYFPKYICHLFLNEMSSYFDERHFGDVESVMIYIQNFLPIMQYEDKRFKDDQ